MAYYQEVIGAMDDEIERLDGIQGQADREWQKKCEQE